MSEALYHLALTEEWDAAVRRGGPYLRSTIGASLEQVGFIHCSFANQVDATRARFYADREDVLLLHIDPSRLTDEVRVEDLHGTGEAFPHLYGPLPLEAVTRVDRLGSS